MLYEVITGQLDRHQQSYLADSRLAIHAMDDALEKLFVHLGLTEGQENALLATVREGLDASYNFV